MTKQLSEEEIYKEAKKRVKARRDFWGHLGVWAAVSVVLIIVWALSERGDLWFLWPVGIWGVFVLFHGIRVFVLERSSDVGAIEREAERIKRERG